jgi:DNA-binding CsgD family transcriptional regulator
MLNERALVVVIVAVQALSAVLFLANIGLPLLGIRPFAWVLHELTEIAALLGLLLGMALGGLALRRSHLRRQEVESQLRVARGAFMELLEERFAAWGLTPAERDVALFAIKGLSTGEIAQLRSTSEGTVKAQTAAIYRKAGVSGRPQLLSLFIEDLIAGPLPNAAPPPSAPPPPNGGRERRPQSAA